ncbi:ABC transporter ATP-binding protein [bacterium]|nr:ABC transporter ATP-binding protein [bacterium]
MPVALKISNLTKVYKTGFIPKKIVALQEVSLDVEQGEIFGLLGPNGAGKTTALKCILSLVHPNSGTIELLGDPVPSPKAMARIGFLSENPYVYEFLSGREYLMFSGQLHGMSKDQAGRKAEELLHFFHLNDAANRPLRKYSKGMLQRIGLAQALVNDPDFLILDEPMSGLDPVGRKEVRDLLLSLKAKGRTLLFSSHILSDAEMICDRVAILLKGKVQMIGKVQTLMKQVDGYEVTINCKQDLRMDGIPHEVITKADSQYLLQVLSIKELHSIITESEKQNFEIESIVPQRQTLEDLYLKRIQE